MSADLKTAASAVGKTLVGASLAVTDTVIYTAAAGVSVKFSKIRVTNADGSARNVTLTIVKAGGAAKKIMSAETVAAGARVDLGSGDWLGEGDSIFGFAPSSTNVDVVISGIEFGGGTGSSLTGIQDDAIGTTAHQTSSTTVTSSILIGNGANRYLLGGLVVANSTFAADSTYTTKTMSCTDGAMTRLAVAEFNPGAGGVTGTVHIFGRANPTSNSTQTLTGTIVKAGITTDLQICSMSFSGVASVNNATTDAPTTSVALNLSVTSAVGNRPIFLAGLYDGVVDFNRRFRAYNYVASGVTHPHYMVLADALGAATVAATTANSTYHAAAGVNLVPA